MQSEFAVAEYPFPGIPLIVLNEQLWEIRNDPKNIFQVLERTDNFSKTTKHTLYKVQYKKLQRNPPPSHRTQKIYSNAATHKQADQLWCNNVLQYVHIHSKQTNDAMDRYTSDEQISASTVAHIEERSHKPICDYIPVE